MKWKFINTFGGKKTSSSHNITYFHERILTANVTKLLRTVDGKKRATHRKYTLEQSSLPSQANKCLITLHPWEHSALLAAALLPGQGKIPFKNENKLYQ